MSIFRGFDESFIKLLDLFFVENFYEPSATIIKQGEHQSKFYILIAGEASVSHEMNGKTLEVATLCGGQFFGEVNLFDPGEATATVTALTPVKTLEISNDKFRYFINYKPELAADFTFQLAETIVKRMRASNAALIHQLEVN